MGQGIKGILKLHNEWLEDPNKGRRAVILSADFSTQNLNGMCFKNVIFDGVSFTGSSLRGTNFRYATFRNSYINDADFTQADLSHATFKNVYAIRTDFSDANLSYTAIRNADFSEAKFKKSILLGMLLTNVNLTKVDIHDCIGNRREIKTLFTDKYIVNYMYDIMQIGCKRYKITTWKSFKDSEINEMETGALEQWVKWNDWIFKAIEMNPAEDWEKDIFTWSTI